MMITRSQLLGSPSTRPPVTTNLGNLADALRHVAQRKRKPKPVDEKAIARADSHLVHQREVRPQAHREKHAKHVPEAAGHVQQALEDDQLGVGRGLRLNEMVIPRDLRRLALVRLDDLLVLDDLHGGGRRVADRLLHVLAQDLDGLGRREHQRGEYRGGNQEHQRQDPVQIQQHADDGDRLEARPYSPRAQQLGDLPLE